MSLPRSQYVWYRSDRPQVSSVYETPTNGQRTNRNATARRSKRSNKQSRRAPKQSANVTYPNDFSKYSMSQSSQGCRPESCDPFTQNVSVHQAADIEEIGPPVRPGPLPLPALFPESTMEAPEVTSDWLHNKNIRSSQNTWDEVYKSQYYYQPNFMHTPNPTDINVPYEVVYDAHGVPHFSYTDNFGTTHFLNVNTDPVAVPMFYEPMYTNVASANSVCM